MSHIHGEKKRSRFTPQNRSLVFGHTWRDLLLRDVNIPVTRARKFVSYERFIFMHEAFTESAHNMM